jgi:hypothetical protein
MSGKNVFTIECPCCGAIIWIDQTTRMVIKSEKAGKKKGSLDDLLLKEKKRRDEFSRKFEATAEMEKEKRKKAQQKFEEAFFKIDEKEEDTE